MKIILLLSLIACGVLSREIARVSIEIWDKILDPHEKICTEKSGATVEDSRNMLRKRHVPDTKEFKCYLRCIYERTKFLTKDGLFNETVVVEEAHFIPHELAAKCIALANPEQDWCEKSYVGANCVVHELAGDNE